MTPEDLLSFGKYLFSEERKQQCCKNRRILNHVTIEDVKEWGLSNPHVRIEDLNSRHARVLDYNTPLTGTTEYHPTSFSADPIIRKFNEEGD